MEKAGEGAEDLDSCPATQRLWDKPRVGQKTSGSDFKANRGFSYSTAGSLPSQSF